MEYALVNIVMGDIADIEKKKSMGISNLILGTRGIPIRRNEKDGALESEVVINQPSPLVFWEGTMIILVISSSGSAASLSE